MSYVFFHIACTIIVVAWGWVTLYKQHVLNGRPRCYRRYCVAAALAAIFAPVLLAIILVVEGLIYWQLMRRGGYEE